MRKYLITGANGAIGSRLCEILKEQGGDLYKLSHSEIDFSLGMGCKEAIKSILKDFKPNYIFHLAGTFSNDFEAAFSINVLSARCILESVADLNHQCRVLLVGSAAEYGIVQSADNPIPEDFSVKPVSIYGLTKAWQTQLAQMFAQHGMDVVIARIFNVDSRKTSELLFIGRLVRQITEIQAGIRTKLEFGRLSFIRDYIDVDLATRKLITVMNIGLTGQIYHVASGTPVVMRDLLRKHLLENNIDPSKITLIEGESNRVGPIVEEIYADTRKFQSLINNN